MSIIYVEGFQDSWIDQVIDLHNKTEMKRDMDGKDFFLSAYKNRYAIITAWSEKNLIGFGSMISDGNMYSTIFDVVIDPNFQKLGIGKEIVQRLINKTPQARIHLTSTFGNEEFYKKMGFKKHKTAMAKYPGNSNYLEE